MATHPTNEYRGADNADLEFQMNDEIDTDVDDADEPHGDFADMAEADFETFLADAIDAHAEENNAPLKRIETFEEAGVLTNNKGLVVRIGEAEFQITIVRSR